MKKRSMRFMALALAMGLTLTGCGSNHYDSAATDMAMDYAGETNNKAAATAGAESFAAYEDADYEMEEAATADPAGESDGRDPGIRKADQIHRKARK